MPTPRALPIESSERQQNLLHKLPANGVNPHRLTTCPDCVVGNGGDGYNTAISKQVNLHRHQVRSYDTAGKESVDRPCEQAGAQG